ncbi:MAG: adenosine kinase [Sphingomonadaceae bacterium]|nr:adenosine kinase [Sphingomonadaceae bacterium]
MTYDVLAIGNAIVDVLSPVDDSFISARGLRAGSMQLISQDQSDELYAAMPPGRECSGGSAANTCAGIAALGGSAGFIGRVGDDQLGRIFAHDIRAAGVEFTTPPAPTPPGTGSCLILVTPDGQRTMNTYLGACQALSWADFDEAALARTKILYLEGYLWDPAEPRAAMRNAIAHVKRAGGKVAFTLSDLFVVERHGADFAALLSEGAVDILFANEVEAAGLTGTGCGDGAADALTGKAETVVITRSEKGALVLTGGERVAVPAAAVERVVDTTGAGDLFAAGFLVGYSRGLGAERSARLGSVAAAEIISHYGARPEADLKALAGGLLA